ncbi:MAG: helix-turn-helix domain-containing protein [Bacteroidetes bacterium]|nr:helix-turn-helix domain-containing protein [Bacteroidota bacterium]
MSGQNALTLIDPQNGNLAFKIFSFEDNNHFDHLQRNNFYSIIWLKEGGGKLKADFSEYEFSKDTLFTFSPYQPYMFLADGNLSGSVIYFHPDFFCIHKHHDEVACHGVLFNNIYQPPFTNVDSSSAETFQMIMEQMKTEMQTPALAQHELLVSYLKIFLITATRLKTQNLPSTHAPITDKKEPFILQNLKDAIEKHFKTKHSASHYAEMLNISPKALGKITKIHFNKTLTDLISERIIIEAKRELYLTNKPVKEIAYELGYEDEYYFSRFFKTNADISPQIYRDAVGSGRGS